MSTFIEYTKRLLVEKRIHGLSLMVPAEILPDDEDKIVKVMDHVAPKPRCGVKELNWGRWVVECVFPVTLYKESGSDLRKLLKHPKFFDRLRPTTQDSWGSFFGWMARPRPPVYPGGFMEYALARMNGPCRGSPSYYFDVESPEWVWEELSRNVKQPRTWRQSVTCCMNIGFHIEDGEVSVHMIMKHMLWSHSWGDYMGAHWMAKAIAKELGLKVGECYVYALTAAMDTPKVARMLFGIQPKSKPVATVMLPKLPEKVVASKVEEHASIGPVGFCIYKPS